MDREELSKAIQRDMPPREPLPPLTPQKAAGILRDANLGGVLRRAADMGIRALTCPDLERDTWQECEACKMARYRGEQYCPKCGHPLTEIAWKEMERRIGLAE